MNVFFEENQLCVEEYLRIRQMVGWKPLSISQAETALKNSLYTIAAYLPSELHTTEPNDALHLHPGRKLVGIGRLVGDGAVICYIQDIIVLPDARHLGIGSRLVLSLRQKALDMTFPGTEMMLDLMCAKGREGFYEQHGFTARPTDTLGPGMIQYLHKPSGDKRAWAASEPKDS